MGWEVRRGKRCYYRKVREGRKVRSVYCGSGERGEAAAREDAERRASRRKPPEVMGESLPAAVGTAPIAPPPVAHHPPPPPAPPRPAPVMPIGSYSRPILRPAPSRLRPSQVWKSLQEGERRRRDWPG